MFRTSTVLRIIVAGSSQFGAMAPKKVADASAARELTQTRADAVISSAFVVPAESGRFRSLSARSRRRSKRRRFLAGLRVDSD